MGARLVSPFGGPNRNEQSPWRGEVKGNSTRNNKIWISILRETAETLNIDSAGLNSRLNAKWRERIGQ